MGDVLLFLNGGSPVFGYDPAVYATVEDGALFALVDAEGRITLLVLDTLSAETTEPAPTVQDLQRAADGPERRLSAYGVDQHLLFHGHHVGAAIGPGGIRRRARALRGSPRPTRIADGSAYGPARARPRRTGAHVPDGRIGCVRRPEEWQDQRDRGAADNKVGHKTATATGTSPTSASPADVAAPALRDELLEMMRADQVERTGEGLPPGISSPRYRTAPG
jgi:hypothetical protein